MCSAEQSEKAMVSTRGIVLVTGSSGLIGSAVIERLVKSFEAIGFDQQGPPHPPAGADCVTVDIASDDSVQKAFAAVRRRHGDHLASVIHLAAYYDFSGEPSPKYDEITVRGTERLLRGLKDFHVEQFVFSSTMLVHAPCEPGQRINEDWPLDPKWDYPRSKVKTEELIRAQHGDMPFVLARIAGVYDDRCHSIPIAHQIQRINERWLTSHVYPGDTSRGQAFIHLDDLIDALLLLVERRQELPPELTLLLGEPETLSYDDLQRELGQLIHGEKWDTRQIPKALAKTGAWLQDNLPLAEEPFIKPWMIDLADDHYELDISRARRLLGWSPRRSLRETLPKMVAALKADPRVWYRANKLKPPDELEETASAPSAGKASHAG
jgi:nucleoside-diphosphate-sugar epimerase